MVRIRPARRDESGAVVAMYEWLFAPPGGPPPGWSVAVATRRVENAITANRSTLLVADDGGLVGLATVYLDLDSVRYGQRAWLEDLAVDPRHRSAGVGKALLDDAKVWARDNQAAHLHLESGLGRVDAHRFYDREKPSSQARAFV